MDVFASYQELPDRVITHAELQLVATRAFQEQLVRFIEQQEVQAATHPAALTRQVSQSSADYYQWAHETRGCAANLSQAYVDQLRGRGWVEERIARLQCTIDASAEADPIRVATLDYHLRALQLPSTAYNRRLVLNAVLPAYRDAVIAADAEVQRRAGIPAHLIDPIGSPVLTNGSGQASTTPSVPDHSSFAGALPTLHIRNEASAPLPVFPVPQPAGWTLEEATEEFLKLKHNNDPQKNFRSAGQVRYAFSLLIHCVGEGFPISKLAKAYIGLFVDLVAKLPNRPNRTSAERTGGIVASLERAAALPASEVGVARATVVKHLTWLQSVIDFADRRGHPASEEIKTPDFYRDAAKDHVRARDRRPNWTDEEIARLLAAPPLTGCAGIEDTNRWLPGPYVFHDSYYFAPLMLIHMGERSAEVIGMMLADVCEEAPVPYLWIRDNKARRVKMRWSRKIGQGVKLFPL